jgi:hypothetical protein
MAGSRRPETEIAPVVVSFVAILLTTLVLFMIDSYLARRTAGLSSDKTY